jgi:hypothetical protein
MFFIFWFTVWPFYLRWNRTVHTNQEAISVPEPFLSLYSRHKTLSLPEFELRIFQPTATSVNRLRNLLRKIKMQSVSSLLTDGFVFIRAILCAFWCYVFCIVVWRCQWGINYTVMSVRSGWYTDCLLEVSDGLNVGKEWTLSECQQGVINMLSFGLRN